MGAVAERAGTRPSARMRDVAFQSPKDLHSLRVCVTCEETHEHSFICSARGWICPGPGKIKVAAIGIKFKFSLARGGQHARGGGAAVRVHRSCGCR